MVPMVPAESGPRSLKGKPCWHRRGQSKMLSASNIGKGGGSRGGGYPPSSCGVRPFYYIPATHPPASESVSLGKNGAQQGKARLWQALCMRML